MAAALREATPVLEDLAKAQSSRAYINDLPDDAVLYIEPRGAKDEAARRCRGASGTSRFGTTTESARAGAYVPGRNRCRRWRWGCHSC